MIQSIPAEAFVLVVACAAFLLFVAYRYGYASGYDDGHTEGHEAGYEEAEKEADEDRATAEEVYQAADILVASVGGFRVAVDTMMADMTTKAAALQDAVPEPEVDDPNMDDDK